MTINEQDRQAQIAAEAEALTRTLAHSTREVPKPVVCEPPGLECRGGQDPGRAVAQNSGSKPSRPKTLTLSFSGHLVDWFPEGPASKGEIMAHQFVAEWWPELFEGLTKVQRRAVLNTLASSYHEGWEPNREDVENATDYVRGAIDRDEYRRRAFAAIQRRRGTEESAS